MERWARSNLRCLLYFWPALRTKTFTMRLSYAALILALGTGLSTNAQLLNIKNLDNQVVNSTTVWYAGEPSDNAMELDLLANLNGLDAKTVNVKRYESVPVMGTKNYFCWGECWLEQNAGTHPVWYAITPVELAPGVDYNGFHAYYKPQGMDTTACFRFVWFDENNTSDTVWVDVCFSTTGAGVEDLTLSPADMNVVPNPTNGAVPTVQFAGNGANAEGFVVVRSATGATVMTQRKTAGQQSVALDGAELPEGVYFASLEQDGRNLATRRVVVTR